MQCSDGKERGVWRATEARSGTEGSHAAINSSVSADTWRTLPISPIAATFLGARRWTETAVRSAEGPARDDRAAAPPLFVFKFTRIDLKK